MTIYWSILPCLLPLSVFTHTGHKKLPAETCNRVSSETFVYPEVVTLGYSMCKMGVQCCHLPSFCLLSLAPLFTLSYPYFPLPTSRPRETLRPEPRLPASAFIREKIRIWHAAGPRHCHSAHGMLRNLPHPPALLFITRSPPAIAFHIWPYQFLIWLRREKITAFAAYFCLHCRLLSFVSLSDGTQVT